MLILGSLVLWTLKLIITQNRNLRWEIHVLFCLFVSDRDNFFLFFFFLSLSPPPPFFSFSECRHFHWPLFSHILPSYLGKSCLHIRVTCKTFSGLGMGMAVPIFKRFFVWFKFSVQIVKHCIELEIRGWGKSSFCSCVGYLQSVFLQNRGMGLCQNPAILRFSCQDRYNCKSYLSIFGNSG